MPDKKKVVIIGAGAGGVFTAYLLKKNLPSCFDIEIFEKKSQVGGHTISHPQTLGLTTINVDGGAQFFSDTVQPQYVDMLKEEGLFTAPIPIIERDVGITIWNFTKSELLFRIPDNLPEILEKIDDDPLDWLNFVILSGAAIEHYAFGDWSETFGTWLDKLPFLLTPSQKEAFKQNIARPLMYQFGLVEPKRLDDLSAKFVVYYYVGSLPWKGDIAGPFRVYNSTIGLDGILEELIAKYGLVVHASEPVASVTRDGDGYKVTTTLGTSVDADEVVYATNPPWTKDLLPTDTDFDAVRDVLSEMEYVTVPVQIQHTASPDHMPGVGHWSASNVLKVDDALGDATHYMLSVWFGPLRDETMAEEYFKSWGSPNRVPEGSISALEQEHRLMVGTPKFIGLRKQLREIHQGEHHLWYVGGYLVDYDAQNACLKSAALVASKLIAMCLAERIDAAPDRFLWPLQTRPTVTPMLLSEPQFRGWPPLLEAIAKRLVEKHSSHEAVAAWLASGRSV